MKKNVKKTGKKCEKKHEKNVIKGIKEIAIFKMKLLNKNNETLSNIIFRIHK